MGHTVRLPYHLRDISRDYRRLWIVYAMDDVIEFVNKLPIITKHNLIWERKTITNER